MSIRRCDLVPASHRSDGYCSDEQYYLSTREIKDRWGQSWDYPGRRHAPADSIPFLAVTSCRCSRGAAPRRHTPPFSPTARIGRPVETVERHGEGLRRPIPRRTIMASCPKCGRAGIKRRKGERACRRCGPLSAPQAQGVQS